ncbi:MAG TPA: DNA primase [Solirubrobacterales bacterium]|nr:DNA primase [Solirubrobacterales bacterium]
MSKFTPETVDRVKEAADVVEIVSAYTDLRRAGERFMGLCPFHEERTPSFSVDPREKLYHCFGCGVGGDVIKFVEEKEGLSFPEAVEALGDRYGVEVERERDDPRAEEARRRRIRLSEVLERTAQFYAHYLWESEEAAKAREYLAGRGLGEEVLRGFGVGYAPSAWDQVLTRGQTAGYSVAELLAAGLAQKGRKGGHYDRFRARIIFPVRDGRGRVQGFGARALRADSKPKYLNSPEGELYRKGRTLYGIDRARGAIAKTERAVVVEGYTDVLAAHQAGIEETVAVMGTAITPDQLQQLSRYTEEVVLALDADRAGRAAMLRAQRVAGSRKLRLRVATMPVGEDPAQMLEGGDARRVRELLEGAVELPEFHVRLALDEADLSSPAGRDRALDEVVPVLAAMGESISRDELARLIADRLDADPGLVTRRVTGERRGERAGVARSPAAAPVGDGGAEPPRALSARERRERALLSMCIAAPEEGREFLQRLGEEHLSSPAAVRARDWLAGHMDDPLAGLPREDEQLVSLVTQLVMSAEREPGAREAMELNFLQLEQFAVEGRIESARREGGDPPVDLQRQRAELAERIAHWETTARA